MLAPVSPPLDSAHRAGHDLEQVRSARGLCQLDLLQARLAHRKAGIEQLDAAHLRSPGHHYLAQTVVAGYGPRIRRSRRAFAATGECPGRLRQEPGEPMQHARSAAGSRARSRTRREASMRRHERTACRRLTASGLDDGDCGGTHLSEAEPGAPEKLAKRRGDREVTAHTDRARLRDQRG